MFRTNGECGPLFAALAKIQSTGLVAVKSAVNPHLRTNYADFMDICQTIRPEFAANGLFFAQALGEIRRCEKGSPFISITTIVGHKDGAWVEFGPASYPVPEITTKDGRSATNAAQAVGSAITYAKRQALAAACGVATGDDDDAERMKQTMAEAAGMANGSVPATAEGAPFWEVDWQNFTDEQGVRLGELKPGQILALLNRPHVGPLHTALMAWVWNVGILSLCDVDMIPAALSDRGSPLDPDWMTWGMPELREAARTLKKPVMQAPI
jgi:hypothetical protein